MSSTPDRNLALELVRVTEAAALGAARWIGRGDKEAADQAAVDGMHAVLPTVHMDGIVVIGDAAHAMSPQLGLGANLCLADAWSLATTLRSHVDLHAALPAYVADRRAHIRWYTWLSRIMTPVFQSDLVPIGWARDALFGPIGRLPQVRRQLVEIELGGQTSPWTTWSPGTACRR